MPLVQKSVAKDDPDPKAISCYGLYVPELDGQTWLRFVDGRAVSHITTRFLEWSCQKLEALGKKVLLLIWDNASWHVSKEVRRWLGKHNRGVKKSGEGVRIVSCLLPKKSPWLNAIEPKWVHGKRKVVEPDGVLGAYELADRVCRVFECPHYEHLSVTQNVASACTRFGWKPQLGYDVLDVVLECPEAHHQLLGDRAVGVLQLHEPQDFKLTGVRDSTYGEPPVRGSCSSVPLIFGDQPPE